MDDVLLTKYLLGETSEAEATAVRRWISAHPDNEKRFSGLRLIWDTSQSVALESKVDEQEAWQRFQQRRQHASDESGRSSKGMLRRMGWLRVAAVLVLGSIAAFGGYQILLPENAAPLLGAVHETTDAVSTDTLADGSVITLDRHASLRFSQGLFKRGRHVELRGGAVFFKVAPDRDKPFVIQSGNVTVTVLGTSFHVIRAGDETTVIVETGKVRVAGLDKAVELEARQKVTINTATDRFDESVVVGVLDHTPLWRIAEILQETYGVKVKITNADIRNLPMTTTLHGDTLQKTLNVIAETLGITVSQQGNIIIFD